MARICLLFIALSFFISGCQESAKKEKAVKATVKVDSNFPQIMVGTWQAPPSIQDVPGWQITFENDGRISKIYHRIFQQPIMVNEGGFDTDGPDPGTYMVVTLGPVETEYDPVSKIIKAKIITDNYEMKFPSGSLEGRMIDTLVGKVSDDGQSWQAEWRNYGWLKGATEPNIAFIDKNPNEIIVFQKLHPGDPNIKSQ